MKHRNPSEIKTIKTSSCRRKTCECSKSNSIHNCDWPYGFSDYY